MTFRTALARLHSDAFNQVLPKGQLTARERPIPRKVAGEVSADTQTEVLRIELLGGFRIACGADEIPDDGWRLAKARSLVKIVALAPSQSIHREQLVDLLWPELDPDAGSNNLHQALHVARRTLGALFPETKPNRILRLQRGVLSLEPPAPLWIDAESFEREARELQSTDDPASFYPTLDIYRGDLLPDDLYEDWAAERRIALHEQYLSLLDRLAALHRARYEATPAIDALRRVVAIEPDREEAHRGLMELYALTGRRQQAIRQYERAREILERELELEPEPETDDLYDAILSGAFPAETWEIEAAEPQPVSRPEITESIADFLGRAGDFVGRSEELGILQNALERVIGDEGEIILVAGEAGIGKTRMSEEFLRYASAQGVRTLWGRCYEGDGAPAYWPWVQVVRSYMEGRSTAELRTVMGPGAADIARIAPELRERLPDLEEPPPLDPDGERFRLFDSMTTFLKNAAERAPLALIIDDLHSADRSSLLLLEFLAREVAETGLLIVGTYRHVEVDRGHPLTRTLGQLARHEANERITLEGLSVADIDRYIELVTGRAAPEGLAAAIHEQTEGNPFFVREIVALLIEEERLNNPEDVRSWRLTIPHGIRETIALRTARLTDTAHRVLTTASVSGRDFELPIVAQVADLDELDTLDALEEALGTGLIVESPPTPGGFRFTHAITRQTLYDDLSQARRLRMHLRTGETLENSTGGQLSKHLLEIAQHFYLAASVGGSDKAISYLTEGGRQLYRSTAYDEAADFFERALEISRDIEEADPELLSGVLCNLAEASLASGRSTYARDRYREAFDIAVECNLSEIVAKSAIGYADAQFTVGYDGSSLPKLLAAFDAVAANDSSMLELEVITRLSRSIAIGGASSVPRKISLQQLGEKATRIARDLDDATAQTYASMVRLDASLSLGDREARYANIADYARWAHETGESRFLLPSLAWEMHQRAEVGDIEGFIATAERYGEVAAEDRRPHYRWPALVYKTMPLILRGQFDEAEEPIEEALQLGLKTAPSQAREVYFTQLFVVRREQGRLNELIDAATRLHDLHPGTTHFGAFRCLTLLEGGNVAEGQCLYSELCSAELENVSESLLRPTILALLSEACAIVGDRCRGSAFAELLMPYSGLNLLTGGVMVTLGAIDYYIGLSFMTNMQYAAANRFFESAARLNQSMGARPPLSRAIRGSEQLNTLMANRATD